MKKIFTTFIVGMVVILFTACGGRNSNYTTADGKIDVDKVAKDALKTAKVSNSFSLEAAESFIKNNGGLNPSNIKPSWEYTLEPEKQNCYGDNSHGVIRYVKPDKEILTKEAFREWVRQIYDATKVVSDDKINIKGFEDSSDKETAVSEKPLDEMFKNADEALFDLGMFSWGYRYKGKFMRVYTELINKGDTLYAAQVDIANAMQKSMEELMKDAEKALEKLNL